MSQVTSQNALVKDSTVQTLNGKLDNLNATLGGNANIAPVFNTATAYSKGDMVNYNGDLYVFTANHSAGAWTGSDAVQTKVSSELSSLKSGLTNVVKSATETITANPTGWIIFPQGRNIVDARLTNVLYDSLVVSYDPEYGYLSRFHITQNTITPQLERFDAGTDYSVSYHYI